MTHKPPARWSADRLSTEIEKFNDFSPHQTSQRIAYLTHFLLPSVCPTRRQVPSEPLGLAFPVSMNKSDPLFPTDRGCRLLTNRSLGGLSHEVNYRAANGR